MTTTVPLLGARALRKIGVTMVADANRPGAAPAQTAAQIADDMLRQMGIIVPEASRPGAVGTIGQTEIAARALRAVGANPAGVVGGIQSNVTMTVFDVAAIALRHFGIPIVTSSQPAPVGTVTRTQIAGRALQAVGSNPEPPPFIVGTGITWAITDIGLATLLKLTVIASDETPSTSDLAYANQAASAVHDILQAADFVTWAPTAIPNAAFEWYVGMTAVLIAPAFGKPSSPEGFTVSEAMIRGLALSGANGQALAELRVAAVHEELNALGLVSWSVDLVPVAHVEQYTRMTVALLMPIYKPETAQDEAASMAQYTADIAAIRQAGVVANLVTQGDARSTALHDMLVADAYVTWTNALIPDQAGEFYVIMLVQLLSPQLSGKPADMDVFNAAKASIREMAISGTFGQALAEAKVIAVHEELNALALVSWAINAIPTSWADWYVDLAVTKLWSIYKTETTEDRKANIEADLAVMSAMKRAAFVVGALARAEVRVGLVHEELNAIGLVTWTSNTIPVAASDCYMAMASSKMEAEGGAALTDAQYAAQVQRVRMIAMGGPAGQALAEQKVRAVHYSLEARGRVRWTLYDIPDFAEEDYVFMAATLLAPECGVKPDPTWDMRAERDLMRIVSIPTNGDPVRADYF
jgi:hypothetical protein